MGTPERLTEDEITNLLSFLQDNTPELMGMTELRGILLAQNLPGNRWLAFLSKGLSMTIDFKDNFGKAASAIEKEYSDIFCCHIPEEGEKSFREKWQHSGATINRIFTQETKPAPSE